MSKGYENFNNMETSFRKSTLIQERIGLVSTHMYKQFLDYQHATMNTTEIFAEMIDNLKATADSLKQSFAARGISMLIMTRTKQSLLLIFCGIQ